MSDETTSADGMGRWSVGDRTWEYVDTQYVADLEAVAEAARRITIIRRIGADGRHRECRLCGAVSLYPEDPFSHATSCAGVALAAALSRLDERSANDG